MAKIELVIESDGKVESYEVRQGMGFQGFSAKHQAPIEYDCRKADCGICIIKVLEGLDALSDKTPAEQDFLVAMRADADERLACQCRILGPVRLLVEN